jgi:hypothetical protein
MHYWRRSSSFSVTFVFLLCSDVSSPGFRRGQRVYLMLYPGTEVDAQERSFFSSCFTLLTHNCVLLGDAQERSFPFFLLNLMS